MVGNIHWRLGMMCINYHSINSASSSASTVGGITVLPLFRRRIIIDDDDKVTDERSIE